MADDGVIIPGIKRDNRYEAIQDGGFITKTDNNGTPVRTITFKDVNAYVQQTFRTMDKNFLSIVGSTRTGTSNNGFNLTLYKHDAHLNQTWQKTYALSFPSYQFNKAVDDEQGNIFVYFNFYSQNTCGNLLGILKFSSTGDLLWVKTYSIQGSSIMFEYSDITVLNGSVFITSGYTYSETGTLLCRLNPNNGEVMWAKKLTAQNAPVRLGNGLTVFNGKLLLQGSGADANGNHPLLAVAGEDGNILMSKSYAGEDHNDNYTGIVSTDSDSTLTVTIPLFNDARNGQLLYTLNRNLKVTTSLLFDRTNTSPQDIKRDAYGNLYEMDIDFYSDAYRYSFTLKKYLPDNSLGECSGLPYVVKEEDYTINSGTIPVTAASYEGVPRLSGFYLAQEDYVINLTSIACSAAANCTSFSISGINKVCDMNRSYSYRIQKNSNCTLQPQWVYDRLQLKINSISEDSISVQFLQPGSIQLKALLNIGCKLLADSVTTIVSPAAAHLSLGNDTLLFHGGPLLLYVGEGFSSYDWQDHSTRPDLLVSAAGAYYLTVTNACNEKAGDTIVVSFDNLASLSLGEDVTKCNGDSVRLQAGNDFSNYSWFPSDHTTIVADGMANVYPELASKYKVSAIKSNGCPTADSVLVTVNHSPAINLPQDRSICSGDAAILLDAGNGFSTYIWNTGETTQMISAAAKGTYSVSAIAANGCQSRDTFSLIEVNPLPVADLGRDTAICRQTSYRLHPGNFASYRWFDGSAAATYLASKTGKVWVTVKNEKGCINSDTVEITGILPLPQSFLADTASLCYGERLTIKSNQLFSSYLWSAGSRNSTLTVSSDGSYWLEATDSHGCSGKDTIRVSYKNCGESILFPTAFTPNCNGTNDVFRVIAHGFMDAYHLVIYNRFGEKVFETTDVKNGWDGSIKGLPLDAGVFVCYAEYKVHGKNKETYKGKVVLLR